MENLNQAATIYQFNKKYWIVEKSRQAWPENEGPTEYIGVSYSADEDVPDDKLGKALIDALDNFNKTKPKYPVWEVDKTRKDLALSMGARGWPSFFKNTKILWISRTIDGIKMIPVDNCNIEGYESAIEELVVIIPNTSSNQEIGAAIKKTMALSTYHPKRKL